MISAFPEMLAHSPEGVRNATLTCSSALRSSVLPDSVLVWKIASIPLPSCYKLHSASFNKRDQDDFSSLTVAARAMHRDASRLSFVRVVNMQNLCFLMNCARSSTFSLRPGSSRFFCLYGSAGLLPVVVLLYSDILGGSDVTRPGFEICVGGEYFWTELEKGRISLRLLQRVYRLVKLIQVLSTVLERRMCTEVIVGCDLHRAGWWQRGVCLGEFKCTLPLF